MIVKTWASLGIAGRLQTVPAIGHEWQLLWAKDGEFLSWSFKDLQHTWKPKEPEIAVSLSWISPTQQIDKWFVLGEPPSIYQFCRHEIKIQRWFPFSLFMLCPSWLQSNKILTKNRLWVCKSFEESLWNLKVTLSRFKHGSKCFIFQCLGCV